VLVVPDPDKPEYHIIASHSIRFARGAGREYSALVRSVVAEAAPESEESSKKPERLESEAARAGVAHPG